MKCINLIKKKDEICSKIKKAYEEENIPLPYPAANKQLQSRLNEFVSKGLIKDQLVSKFDKVNSNRTYILEKQNDIVHLMIQVKEKNEATKKLIVLRVDDEIKVIVDSFVKVFEETGFIESAPKCHKRLRDTYAISDGRIRLVQRILSKYVAVASKDDGHEDGDDNNKQDGVTIIHSIPNDENLPPPSSKLAVTTRSKSVCSKKRKNVCENTHRIKTQDRKRSKKDV